MLVIRKKRDKELKGLDGREKSGICIFEEEREKKRKRRRRRGQKGNKGRE